MDNQGKIEEKKSSSPTRTTARKHQVIKKLVFGVLLIVITGGLVVATFYWQHQKVATLKKEVSSLQSQSSKTHSSLAVPKANQIKFIRSVGFPYDLKSTIVTSDLGVPADIEAVHISSDNNDRGSEQIFTDKYNDEMARYTLSYPQFASDGDNEISILAISPSWLNSSNQNATYTGGPGDTNIEPQLDLQSPESKAAYVLGLSTMTQQCIDDPAKGFQTKDKVLSICYEVDPDKYGGPSTLSFRGYGVVQDEPLILVGLIFLDDHYDVLNPLTSGVHLQATTDATKEIVYALSQTTITASNR